MAINGDLRSVQPCSRPAISISLSGPEYPVSALQMRQSAIYLFDRAVSTAAAATAISAIARMGVRNRGRSSVRHGRDGASQISARLLWGSIVNFHGIPRADNTRNTGGRQMRDRRCSPELLTTQTTRLETRNKREHLDYRPAPQKIDHSNVPPLRPIVFFIHQLYRSSEMASFQPNCQN